MNESVHDLAVTLGYGNMLNTWKNVPRTCLQVIAYGADYVGTFHLRHDPDCTKDHVKEEEK